MTRTLLISGILLTLLSSTYIHTKNMNPSSAPLPEKIGEWARKGEPEKYSGEDLFLYINGGADIYNEYGFRDVFSSEYEKEGAGRISVELYRMADPVSAFGIFSFRTGGKWEAGPQGGLYAADEYYINLLTREYLITITSIDINEETGKGIHEIRHYFSGMVSRPASPPDVFRFIDPAKYPKRIFFKGDLGMMNSYNLFSGESGILHGIAGTGGGGMVMALEFPPGKTPDKQILRIIALLRKDGRYSRFRPAGGGTCFTDGKKSLLIKPIKGFVFIFIENNPGSCVQSADHQEAYLSSGIRPVSR